jgi:hypothetical protein
LTIVIVAVLAFAGFLNAVIVIEAEVWPAGIVNTGALKL